MILSKSKLIPLLVEAGFIDGEKAVGYEAYGKKIFAYVQAGSRFGREKLEAFLKAQGIGYGRTREVAGVEREVRVAYFRAHHWDE